MHDATQPVEDNVHRDQSKTVNSLLITAALTTITAGCGGSNLFAPPGDRVAELHVLSGDGQSAPVGTTLPSPVIVLAVDQDEAPVPGVTLVASAPGRIEPTIVRTDADGAAAFHWTLPADTGRHVARIGARSSTGATDPPELTIMATAVPHERDESPR